MSDPLKMKVAAAVTALFLAAISAAGLMTRFDGSPEASPAPAAAVATQTAAPLVSSPAVVAYEGEGGEDAYEGDDDRYEGEEDE